MIDICEALYKHLKSVKEIQCIVSDRIYPLVLPQNCVLPAICYSPIIANYDSALQGDTGYVRQTIQIVCHDKTYKKARKLSRIVKKAIQDLHGNMGGLFIEAVFIKTDFDLDGNSSLKFDVDEYMSSIEFEFHYNENK